MLEKMCPLVGDAIYNGEQSRNYINEDYIIHFMFNRDTMRSIEINQERFCCSNKLK